MAKVITPAGPTATSSSMPSPTFPWPPQPDFLHLFRTFRLAINPTQLIVALLALLLIYASGRTFDVLWGRKVTPDQIETFRDSKPGQYARLAAARLRDQQDSLREMLDRADTVGVDTTELAKNPSAAYRVIRASAIKKFQSRVAESAAMSAGFRLPDDPPPGEQARQDREAAARRLQSDIQEAKDAAGRGIFDALMRFEILQCDNLVENTLSLIRVVPITQDRPSAFATASNEQALGAGLFSRSPDRFYRSDTVVGCLANMTIIAPAWLFTGTEPMQWQPDVSERDSWRGWIKTYALHRLPYLFTLILLLGFWLLVIALAGALICRLSALQFVNAQASGIKPVMEFALSRFGTFIKAPIMPLLIILAVGLAMSLIALIGAIPFVGEILIGGAFVLFIFAGFVMTLMLLGVVGGFNLLYPTIAVEGSDAFDALSRAFAYAYARPWKLLWYTVIALLYGVITYLFLAFAIYLVLALTHFFVGLGMSAFGLESGWYNGAPKLETLWPTPHLFALNQPINWEAMNFTEWVGASFLSFWIYLVITLQGAYLLSYYFSVHTVMYLLLRKAVDGQTLTDLQPPAAEGESPEAVA